MALHSGFAQRQLNEHQNCDKGTHYWAQMLRDLYQQQAQQYHAKRRTVYSTFWQAKQWCTAGKVGTREEALGCRLALWLLKGKNVHFVSSRCYGHSEGDRAHQQSVA